MRKENKLLTHQNEREIKSSRNIYDKRLLRLNKNNKAQMTIFIILAIVIVAGVGVFFLVRNNIGVEDIPTEIEPVYEYYLSCLEQETLDASIIAQGKGGYIKNPDFSPGNEYYPFSNQLDFFGTGIPYWFYITSNGFVDEQIPSKAEIQEQLEDYLKDRIEECSFSQFTNDGFEIETGDIKVDSIIKDKTIEIQVEQDLDIVYNELSWSKNTHNVEVNSQLGGFYEMAKEIYEKQTSENFLEEYGVDVLRLYAPVDGVEIQCSPKVWLQQDIKEDLATALEANVQSIKLKGNYYELNEEENKYFVKDLGMDVDYNINFLYSRTWPTKISIYPDENPLIAEPVGPEQGLGILGFCYVPYHFVYDLAYPVLVQIYSNDELFQFPVAVVIDKNKPIEGLNVEALPDAEPELCKYQNQELSVYTYNIDLEPVEAEIEFECLGEGCDIGKTELNNGEASLTDNFPRCVNGYVVANAEGYAEKRYLYSTNEQGNVNIVLDKLYDLEVDLRVDNQRTDDFAMISFVSEDYSQTIAWPDQKEIKLKAGEYDISVYVYRDSDIVIPAVKDEKCVESPKSGLLGFFGMSEEKCFTIDLPSQTLENTIGGGGKSKDYFIESMLEDGQMVIDVESLPAPRALEEVQTNFNLLEFKPVYINFE